LELSFSSFKVGLWFQGAEHFPASSFWGVFGRNNHFPFDRFFLFVVMRNIAFHRERFERQPIASVDIQGRRIFESLYKIGINRFLKSPVEALAAH
jgi:hypothetical protein